jgi:hypothetical protein
MSSFRSITRQAIIEHRERQQRDGFTFPLAATSLGMPEVQLARVRRLTTMDRAAIEQLPQDVQAKVWDGLRIVQEERRRADGGEDPRSLLEAVTNNEKVLPAANAYCIASFIDPVLVASEAELAQHPNAMLVDDIAAEDRVTFFWACNDPNSEAARSMKLFRPPVEADATPAHVPAGPAEPVAPTPFRAPEPQW